MKQQQRSAGSPEFKKRALKILRENKLLIIFSKYWGIQDFYQLDSETEFDIFLKNRYEKECLILFKNKFKVVNHTVITPSVKEKILAEIRQIKTIDWVAIGKSQDNQQWSTWIDDKQVFESIDEEDLAKETLIVENQDWTDKATTIHAYVPDEDGVVRAKVY